MRIQCDVLYDFGDRPRLVLRDCRDARARRHSRARSTSFDATTRRWKTRETGDARNRRRDPRAAW